MKTIVKIILISIVCLELCLQVAAFFTQRSMELGQHSSDPQSGKIKVLCLGESTTAWGGHESYPSQLERKLNSSAPPDRFQVFNKGMTSSNSAQILQSFPDIMRETNPDIAVIMMGINDYWSLPDEPPSWWASTVQDLGKYLKIFKLIQIASLNFDLKNNLKMSGAAAVCSKREYNMIGIVNGFPKDLPVEAKDEFVAADEEIRHRETLHLGVKHIIQLVDRYKSVTVARAAALTVESIYGLLQDTAGFEAVRDLCHAGLQFDSKDLSCRIFLGRSLSGLNEDSEAIKVLESLYAEKPPDFSVYLELARLYSKNEKIKDADQVLADGISVINKNGYCDNSFYLQRARFELQELNMHKPELALQTITEDIRGGANPGRLSQLINAKLKLRKQLGLPPDEVPRADMTNFWQNSSFQKNLHAVVLELIELHKKVIVMQYPRRSVAPLKEILADVPDVIYVENVQNFEEFLKSHKFEEAFSDNFAGDFGHFTAAGADLVSQAAAQAILSSEKH